jgi:hypothetical protein
MANIQITQLPTAGAITGTEAVPIVQNGVTVQTTTGAIAASPAQTQTFLTVNQEPTLPNSRYMGVGNGLTITDAGSQGVLRISPTGVLLSLINAGDGLVAKSGASVIPRSLQFTGQGLSITNGNGVAGDPTIALDGLTATISGLSGYGQLTLLGTGATIRQLVGTSNQITISDGAGTSGNPTFAIANNPVLPGSSSTTLTSGSTANRPLLPTLGMVRFNTDLGAYEGYVASGWQTFSTAGGVASFSAGSTGLTPDTPVSGAVTLGGTLNASSGGTGASGTLTGYVYGNGAGAMTASTTIPNAGLANSSVTYNGVAVALGASGTITAVNPNALTIGTGLSGTSYNGSAAVTIAIDSTVATLTGSQTLTNKSISGAANTLTNIPNSALTNSSVTVGTTSIALGAASLTLGGLTSVALTQDPVSALQAATKQYVDAAVSNVNYHAACNYATTADLGAVTYNNGSSGVGATITNAGTQAALVIDGHTFTATDVTNAVRILVKNETSGQYNGVYTLTNQGSGSTNWVLTRALDYDQVGSGTNEIAPGDTMFVLSGTVNTNTQWVQTTGFPITIGTTPITFVQIAGPGAYTAGTGLTLTGTQFSLTSPVTAALGGTGQTSYATGDILYASASTTLSKLTIGTNGYVLTSTGTAPQYVAQSTLSVGSATTATTATTATNLAGGTTGAIHYQSGVGASTFLTLGTTNYVLTAGASAPQYVAQSTLSVGSATSATNATNTAITANSTNATNYLTFVSATTGNLGQLVNSSITCNPSTGSLTGGISGGTF